tara:strand:- start:417 stop:851 length:435 start_codon:yes stop_codon:yes gene_type:complete
MNSTLFWRQPLVGMVVGAMCFVLFMLIFCGLFGANWGTSWKPVAIVITLIMTLGVFCAWANDDDKPSYDVLASMVDVTGIVGCYVIGALIGLFAGVTSKELLVATQQIVAVVCFGIPISMLIWTPVGEAIGKLIGATNASSCAD